MNVRDSSILNPTIGGQQISVLAGAGTYNTDPMDVGNFIELIFFLIATAITGTSPTLDCKIQYSPDKKNWIDSGDSFTQITGTTATNAFKKASANFGKYIRLVITLGGTTPNYTLTAPVAAKS